MSRPWWTPETAATPRLRDQQSGEPELVSTVAADWSAELQARRPVFTPEWRGHGTGDAGEALLRLQAENLAALAERLDRLPEQAYAVHLQQAGIEPLPASPAASLVVFELSQDAPRSITIPEGFQVGAQPADGSGELVRFETRRSILGTAAGIAELRRVADGGSADLLAANEAVDETLAPFGSTAGPGAVLYIGLDARVPPYPSLSLGIGLAPADGQPAPVASGAVAPLPTPPPPTLRWQILQAGSWQDVEVVLDETASLSQSGVVELRLPRGWRAGRPAELDAGPARHWLRLRIQHGQFDPAPSWSFLRLNAVRVTATETRRNEVLRPVDGGDGRDWQLARRPVVAGSLDLVVIDPVSGEPQPWTETTDLLQAGPEEPVYRLDPANGLVRFGDGIHGKVPVRGERSVVARAYRVGSGAAGAVAADEISVLVQSAPFVTGVGNPLAASGGRDGEAAAATLRRGPAELRARGRAVMAADYALLATRAPGALVARAHAVAGLHPLYPGSTIPGVVGVYVVPPVPEEGPPIADEATLQAVGRYLSEQVAPAGVEVVCAVPRFQSVQLEVGLVVAADADVGSTVNAVLQAADVYLHPISGGADGSGWPFGEPIRYAALQRRLLAVAGVQALAHLSLRLDGLRRGGCADVALATAALPWPAGHQVVPVEAEAGR